MGGRLIDADKLIELIDDDIAALDNDIPQIAYDVCLCTLKMVKQYIKALPKVEVMTKGKYAALIGLHTTHPIYDSSAPLDADFVKTVKGIAEIVAEKHGRWLPSDKGDCTYICSGCGFIRDAYILEENAYCPRCGADMREVEE